MTYKQLVKDRDIWKEIFKYLPGDDLASLSISCKAFRDIIYGESKFLMRKWGEHGKVSIVKSMLMTITGPVIFTDNEYTALKAIVLRSMDISMNLLIISSSEARERLINDFTKISCAFDFFIVPCQKNKKHYQKLREQILSRKNNYNIILTENQLKMMTEIFSSGSLDVIFTTSPKALERTIDRASENIPIFYISKPPEYLNEYRERLSSLSIRTGTDGSTRNIRRLNRLLSSCEETPSQSCRKYLKVLFNDEKYQIYLLNSLFMTDYIAMFVRTIKLVGDTIVIYDGFRIPSGFPDTYLIMKASECTSQNFLHVSNVIMINTYLKNIRWEIFDVKRFILFMEDDLLKIINLRISLIPRNLIAYYIQWIRISGEPRLIVSEKHLKFLRIHRKWKFNNLEIYILFHFLQKRTIDFILHHNLFYTPK